jgi:hypothetical protein
MTLAQLRTALKRYGFDDRDPLDVWLNAAYHEFEDAHEWPFLETMATLSLLSGYSSLPLPLDFFKVISLKDVTNLKAETKLEPYDYRRFEREILDQSSNNVGAPDKYALIGLGYVQVDPVPNYNASLRLVYQRQLADMVDGTLEPEFPRRWHYAIAQGAASIGLMAENEEERATTARAEFDAAIGEAASKLALRELDDPEQVADTQGYFDE